MAYIGLNLERFNSFNRMIDRYTIHAPANTIAQYYEAENAQAHKPRFNAAPSQLLPVITHDSPQGFSYFYWGSAPQWSKNKTFAERIINARVEWLKEKPILKKVLRSHRCLVPATGFYVWKRIGKKTIIPWYFQQSSKELFSFAGLWEEYDDAEGNFFHTFSIITHPSPVDLVDSIDRMPVILSKKDSLVWMHKSSTHEQLIELLSKSTSIVLEGYSVSPAIQSHTTDHPGLIAPVPPADQFGNLTLFD
jgi:putative SOS response-associated peptidase YedK